MNKILGLIFLVCIHGIKGCFEEEKMALLEFKAFVKSGGHDADDLLPSWVNLNDPKDDCCKWERVTCDYSTKGHVIELSLNNTRQFDISSFSIFDPTNSWYLNVSLFQPFKELRILNLSFNVIAGWIQSKDLASLSTLPKLKRLSLEKNMVNEDIISILGTLPSLTSLDLSDNLLEGPLSKRELGNLSKVEVLILRNNNLNGSLPIQDLKAFTNLRILDLSWNFFSDGIPQSIRALNYLEALSLSYNQLNGSLPISGLCRLKRLHELDLSHNSFDGTLPPCLTNLTSLQLLDVSANLFGGNLPSNLIESLTSLKYIDLSHNHFQGSFSFSSIASHSRLEVFMLTGYNNSLNIAMQTTGEINPLFQLKVLVLSDLGLNSIPKFLVYQQQLRAIDLSHNKLKGKLPVWLLANNSQLRFLNLRNNSFTGQFLSPSYTMRNIVWLDLSINQLHGKLPDDFGDKLLSLEYLNLSGNSFEKDLPSSLGKLRNLVQLDLAFNRFSGEVPKELLVGCTMLELLRLSYNRFSGQIFTSEFNLSYLSRLELNNNRFVGRLSNVKLEILSILDVSNNGLSGPIPSWISNVSWILAMGNNYFSGQIPCEELLSLYFVDLSHNLLSGPLPSCLDFSKITQIHLEGNNFSGLLQNFLPNSSNTLSVFNLRDNSLSGGIPLQISTCVNLRILSLGKNQLSGLIPKTLCLLKKINIMDLSSNSFSGTVPSCFHNLTFGEVVRNYGEAVAQDEIFITNEFTDQGYLYGVLLKKNLNLHMDMKVSAGQAMHAMHAMHAMIDIVTKNRLSSYKGESINLMSALDLSCNDLTGEIPQEYGMLSQIHSLNLSHNRLTGPIPVTFSKLGQIESMDLSYNNLSGEIPPELANLNFLEVFNVSYNNLSGEIPTTKAQFLTFDKSSYEGNPFLCGLPLAKNCTTETKLRQVEVPLGETESKWYEVDHLAFLTCFLPAYLDLQLSVTDVLPQGHLQSDSISYPNPEDMLEIICATPIAFEPSNLDSFTWKGSLNDSFSSTSAYNIARGLHHSPKRG
ncbi:hypothetical protein SLE2022_288910 [Rubroshorea leprosula]